jgi:hypothetical protein
MIFRRATGRDWPGILALQEANLFENLDAEARRDGFLSARFSAADFARMDHEAAVVVAEDAGRIAGYACSATIAGSQAMPILAAMIATFHRVSFLGNVLADSRVAIYGPVCVEQAARGRGAFRGLIGKLKEELAGRFEVAAAFIAKSNQRSLAAHVEGLGMTLVGDYEFEGKRLWIVAFGIPAADLACGVGPRP